MTTTVHETAPDLTDYHVVHRAMTTDMRRLAEAAGRLATRQSRPNPARVRALRAYLAGVAREIRSHHRVEDDVLWPLLAAFAGPDATDLDALTDDHDTLDPSLDTALDLAGQLVTTPGDRALAAALASVLHFLAGLLDRHIAAEERSVFPVIRRHVSVADYRRLQREFRRNLRLRDLPFVAPWVASHATADELAHLTADAGALLRLALRVYGRRFDDLARSAFGS